MVLETSVLSIFNQLTQLEARDNFIKNINCLQLTLINRSLSTLDCQNLHMCATLAC
jgi:hypothetical protein